MTESFKESLQSELQTHPGRHFSDEDARDAAVLIPIIGGENPALIFTVRTDTLPSHKGQISFPGGSIDTDDDSPEAAALRESFEEIALTPDAVEVLGRLDSMHTFVSGYVVTPVIGWIDKAPELSPNEAEVAEILQIPLDDLAEEIRSEPGFTHGGRTFPTEAWIWRDQVIWGVTARIVRTFLERLAAVGLGEAPGATTTPWPDIAPSRR